MKVKNRGNPSGHVLDLSFTSPFNVFVSNCMEGLGLIDIKLWYTNPVNSKTDPALRKGWTELY